MKKSGIYKITCVPTGKIYIGSAFNLKIRWIEHQSLLKHNKHHNRYLQSAWHKYGDTAFEFALIEECNIDLIQEREQYWLDFYQSANREFGFNIATIIAAPMAGRKHSEETRKKISVAQKGIPVPSKRRKRSEESVEKTAAFHRGRKRSPETCARIRAARKARPITPAQQASIKKMADGHRGKPLSEEHKKRLSDAKMGQPGRPHTDESRAKMVIAQSNRSPISEETRARMSASRKAYWERKKAERSYEN